GGGATANAMAGAFGSNGATAAAPTNDGWTLVNGDPIVGKSPYRYMDAGVESGVFEYKLEAVMAAAGMNELGTTRVEGTAPRAFSFNVAPNPAATTAKLMINMPTATEVVVRMYDLSGRRVGTVLERPVTEGTHEYAMDVSGMPAGIYILHLEGGGHVSAKRVAVVH
ncbi:MAG: T9SS type A sorting domain-containing protein, partial [Candidatus Zixiibacteriota bacterium]